MKNLLKSMKQCFKDGMKTAQNNKSFKTNLTKSVVRQAQKQNKA